MKEPSVSNCERTFLLKCIEENTRLDGRMFDQYRTLKIDYGTDWGSCMVSLGDTRVLAQVSCDIQQPKAGRPTEGLLFLNVELSPMASVYFESGRQSETAVQANRILEKCFKESNCIDLEALCIVAEEKVWNIRVDINVMNYEGNLIGCSSIAALAALRHFRYPEVTTVDGSIVIHSTRNRNPIPLTVRHFPVVLSYTLFKKGEIVVEDPSLSEEKVADSIMLLFINSYDEFCGMHLEGSALPSSHIILKCSNTGCTKARQLVEIVKKSLDDDLEKRANGKVHGLVDSIALDNIMAKSQERLKIQLSSYNVKKEVKKIIKRKKKPKKIEAEDSQISQGKMETDGSSDTPTDSGESSVDSENDLPVSVENIKKEEMFSAVSLGNKSVQLVDLDIQNSNGSSSDENMTDIEILEDTGRKNVEEIELDDDSDDDIIVLDPKDLQ